MLIVLNGNWRGTMLTGDKTPSDTFEDNVVSRRHRVNLKNIFNGKLSHDNQVRP